MNPPHETRTRLSTSSAYETERLGETIATTIAPPIVLAIDGEMGAGKTQLVRGLAKGLGLDPADVASPTFVICALHEGACSMAHMDAYRLGSIDELETIGYEEMLGEQSLVMAIEWASRIMDAIPENRIEIRIAHRGETSRGIEVIDRRDDSHQRTRLSETLADVFDASNIPLGKKDGVCPSCGGVPEEDAIQFRPFCSSRCRMADLGNWLDGYYLISRELTADDEFSD
jgi:tRNA threonylcarbamoyladenosine biosynthesis protein TsaE